MRLVKLRHRHIFMHLLQSRWIVQGLHDAGLAGSLVAFACALPDLGGAIADGLPDLHVTGRLDKLALVASLFGRTRIAVEDVCLE